MKKIIIFLLLVIPISSLTSQTIDRSKARGLFLSLALGPRLPVSDFSEKYSYGVGLNFEISYTDNEFLPLFFYFKGGYDHFAGSSKFYRKSDYSGISANFFPLGLGARLYLPPLVEDMILVVPTVDLGGSYAFTRISNQYKLDSGKINFVENKGYMGFHAGAGISMFLVEIMAYYNYLPQYQSVSADIKVRIPVFIKL